MISTPTKVLFLGAIESTPMGGYLVASSLIAFARERVHNQDGSAVQVLAEAFFNDESALAVSPEIIVIFSKQCPLVMSDSERTCEAKVIDDTKSSSHACSFNNVVVAWLGCN
jgi:hypothetical protein